MELLGKELWDNNNSPKIYVSTYYERKRSGADMQYRVKAVVSTVSGNSSFGYPIKWQVKMDDDTKFTVTLKSASPSKWTSEIEYTSDWFTVSNKTSGTTRLSSNFYSGSGSSRDSYYYYDMTVDPAYFTSKPSISVASKTETTIVINWSTSETCSTVQYKLNGGSWVDIVADANSKSGSYTIKGLTANTSYKIDTDFKRRDSGLWASGIPGSPSTTVSTHDYPKPSSVSNTNIGKSFTVNVNNPLNRTYTLQLISNENGNVLAEYSGNINGNVSGFNNATQQANMYASIPQKTSGTYYAKVTYDGKVKTSGNGTYSINNTELPNFSANDWSYSVNGDYDLLTGDDDSVVIAGRSTVNFQVNNAPTSNYSATFTGAKHGYVYTWGDFKKTLSSDTTASGSNQSSNTLKVTAYDDRGLARDTSKQLDTNHYINYTKPTQMSANTKRKDGIDTETKLNMTGRLGFNSKFGPNGVQNAVYRVCYQVKKGSGSYGPEYDITDYTTSGDSFRISDLEIHADGVSGGFEVGSKYKVKVKVYDALGLLSYGEVETDVTDGKLARDVYQDRNGDYHQGINGRAVSDRTEKIYGDLEVTGQLFNEAVNVTEEGKNLNDFKTTGLFRFTSDVTPVNIPEDNVNGFLQVFHSGSHTKQIWYRMGTLGVNDFNMYIRTFNSNSSDEWSKWCKVLVEDNNGTVKVNGGVLYGMTPNLHEIKTGDAKEASFWCSVPNGIYFAYYNNGVTNLPSNYCFIMKMGHYSTNGSKGDFNVVAWQQTNGNTWRLSGNGNSTTCSWRQYIWMDDNGNASVNGFFGVGKSLRIPKDGSAGYGLCNSDGTTIIADHGNSNVTIRATGGALYLGYRTTTSLNFMDGKGYMNSSGDFTTSGYIQSGGNIVAVNGIIRAHGHGLEVDSRNTNYSAIGGFYCADNSNGELALYAGAGTGTGSNVRVRMGTTYFRPNSSNAVTLGDGSYRWKQLYANTSSINTSDRRLKKEITEFDDKYNVLYDDLKPVHFKFIANESNRVHTGFISQDVEESLEKAGLTALDFAGFCKDKKYKINYTIDENGREKGQEIVYEKDENGDDLYEYALRYEEFIALNTWQIQKLKKENEELKERLARLEEKLNV